MKIVDGYQLPYPQIIPTHGFSHNSRTAAGLQPALMKQDFGTTSDQVQSFNQASSFSENLRKLSSYYFSGDPNKNGFQENGPIELPIESAASK